MTSHHRMIIIGSGPAGYTAAIYAARANLKPLQILGHEPGGQLTWTTDVENYPGFCEIIQGPWLMEQMGTQAKAVGTEMVYDKIERVDFTQRPFRCWGEDGKLYTADSIIIATGAQARWLGLAGETKYRGFGVSACATCDGVFFKDKAVVVVGGGNTALEEALYLTRHAAQVTLIHRRDQFRGEKVLHDKVSNHPQIQIVWNHVVEDITGGELPQGVTGVTVRHVLNQSLQHISTEGVFIAIGHSPATAVFQGAVDMDAEGYILVNPGTTQTNIPGIFAAGDVQDKTFRQAITAAGQGCMAALEAEKYLS